VAAKKSPYPRKKKDLTKASKHLELIWVIVFIQKNRIAPLTIEEKEHTQARLGAEKVLGDHDHIRGCIFLFSSFGSRAR
jgi:hypothetical protein